MATGHLHRIPPGWQDAPPPAAPNKTIKLWGAWPAATPRIATTLKGAIPETGSMRLPSPNSHDGKTLASGAYDKTVRFLGFFGKNPARKEGNDFRGHRGGRWGGAVAFQPDDTMIASGGSARVVKLWTIRGRELKFAHKGHEGSPVRGLPRVRYGRGKPWPAGGEDGLVGSVGTPRPVF